MFRGGAFVLAVAAIAALAPAATAQPKRIDAAALEAELARTKYHVAEVTDRIVTGDLTLRPGQTLQASRAIFEGDLRTANPKNDFKTRANFSGHDVEFRGEVTASGLNYGEFECRRCEFERDVDLHSIHARHVELHASHFRGIVDLIATSTEFLSITDARFEKLVDLSGAQIDHFASYRVRASEPIQITWGQFGERWSDRRHHDVDKAPPEFRRAVRGQVESEFRFWKRNFEALDQRRDAQHAKYEIVKLTRSQDRSWNPETWMPYALDVANGYGTAPYRPLWIAIVMVPLFGVVFRLIGFRHTKESAPQESPEWWFPYGLSLQTFVPFAKIPVVDDSPWELKRLRWVAATESLFGLLLFGIAAYSATVLI
jgi:hypothetical protein